MTLRDLTPLEVRDLISRYQSDLRKLKYQVHKVHQILEELQAYAPHSQEKYIDEPILKELPPAEAPKKKARKTRKGTAASNTSSPAKGEASSSDSDIDTLVGQGKGYRLSEWDLFVVNCLVGEERSLITKDFLNAAKKNDEIRADVSEIKIKLNRSLHKLSNKKGILVKVEYPGRGYAYALATWLNSKGELPKEYAWKQT
jgi:hypothetical protein